MDFYFIFYFFAQISDRISLLRMCQGGETSRHTVTPIKYPKILKATPKEHSIKDPTYNSSGIKVHHFGRNLRP